ncbi:hypothetical protein FYK55_25730 [Roseiconus nitratireducens]|uniref:Uncharacterized protein n=1 Tax=Roseiconus nitratireducens TaxID=2605748 RepID=A0A5M6D0B6_9BACT|nr:hypothetical protein [Roseiconus nitratireducens]KAA5538999.1 hypothetical protein FYK55_25730 [Roseiconus nitratireducens]
MNAARDQGLAHGLEKEQFRGRIQLLENLPGKTVSLTETPNTRSIEELQAQEADLQRRLRGRDLD